MTDFTFKPFSEMTEADYAAIGFRSGLEIHQQLLTAKKLFCRCPAGRYSEKYDAEILRHMRPTLSELGEYDGTALMEFKTKKDIIYQIHRETVCTYEMDDTPPFELNEEALDIALEIAMLYDCNMVDEIHIARKQYLDGSIPTGFQRTTIVGVDGHIPYRDRKINIVQLGLEEDACREVSDIGHRRTYRTDRLGMPLIETVTAPDMRTPQEVSDVANRLRWLVRSTGRVRTGIGAARQDVNVSVTGGTRVEIKGVSRIPSIPMLTYSEAMRQWNLLRLRDDLHRRGITPETFSARYDNVTRLLRKTRYQPIHNAINSGMILQCVTLVGFRDLLHWKTQTDTWFSREISDRIRVIACLTTLPNMIHSDSTADTIAASEWQAIKKAVGAGDDDTIVIVWGDQRDAETGAKEVIIRAREATIGIPSETRQALRDGTNGFERILPGPDRMYPDTDMPPKKITTERLDRIRNLLPEPYYERESWYRTLDIPTDVITPLSISSYAELFKTAVKQWNLDPVALSVALIQYPKRLCREFRHLDVTGILKESAMNEIVDAFRDGSIRREGILVVMRSVLENGGFSPNILPQPCTDAELNRIIENAMIALETMAFKDGDQKLRKLKGLVMDPLRGRVDSRMVMEKVERLVSGGRS
ncbi:Glu-tRNA(Gln) amidotransferase subunit GatE [bacterium]|nr:Glu-tRNA(Gln) amidotransferase subunit GatE [candidate division CSSED10-310 bacterium]